jgi:hypothetical protein
MQTQNIYCGDNWQFNLTKDDEDTYLKVKIRSTSENGQKVERWELEELNVFLNNYLENN